MIRSIFSVLFLFALLNSNKAFQVEKVSLEIIHQDGTSKEVKFDWPFKGPPSVGSNKALLKTVDKILLENEIDCPPKREKISDHIWKCGNGKKVRSKDDKLTRLLTKAWE